MISINFCLRNNFLILISKILNDALSNFVFCEITVCENYVKNCPKISHYGNWYYSYLDTSKDMHGKHTNADGKSCLIIKLFNRIECRRR